MDYSKIKVVEMKSNLSARKFALSIGMTDSGYASMLKNKTCTIRTLETICKTYGVSLSYFFDEPGNQFNEPAAKYGSCKDCLKKDTVIEELRREIKTQRDEIASLNREIGRSQPEEKGKAG